MSQALYEMTGLKVDSAVAVSFLSALYMVCTSKRPLVQLIVSITPEVSFCERRVEAIDRFHSLGQHRFAAAIARRKTRAGELLIVCIDDDGPRLRAIDLSAVKFAFAKTPNAAEFFGGKAN